MGDGELAMLRKIRSIVVKLGLCAWPCRVWPSVTADASKQNVGSTAPGWSRHSRFGPSSTKLEECVAKPAVSVILLKIKYLKWYNKS